MIDLKPACGRMTDVLAGDGAMPLGPSWDRAD